MLFEVHITVEPHDVSKWEKLCGTLKIKPLFIELSNGEYPRQLMCAATVNGNFEDLGDYISKLVEAILKDGFRIVRIKPECPLDSANLIKPRAYYECHLKILIPPSRVQEVREAGRKAGVYISRNLIGNKDNLEKWYLTCRVHKGSAARAARRFNKVLESVKKYLPVERMDKECVIYDSNEAIDGGWIPK